MLKIDCTKEKEDGIYVFDIDDSMDTLSRIFVRLTQDLKKIKSFI